MWVCLLLEVSVQSGITGSVSCSCSCFVFYYPEPEAKPVRRQEGAQMLMTSRKRRQHKEGVKQIR